MYDTVGIIHKNTGMLYIGIYVSKYTIYICKMLWILMPNPTAPLFLPAKIYGKLIMGLLICIFDFFLSQF